MSPAEPLPNAALPCVSFVETAAASPVIADRSLAALLSAGSPAYESLRVLGAKVKALGGPRPLRCLGLVAATPGEGTSAVALGLAAAHTQDDQKARVLLLETTFRAPALERMLGLPPEPGLGDWLAAPGERPVSLRRLEPWGFFLLAGGTSVPQPEEPLGAEPFARLLLAARQSFDLVLVDCPPLATLADTVVLQDLLDGFLLVVRARHASRDTIRRSLTRLRPELVRGVVFNDRTEILSRWLDRRSGRAST